MVMAGTNNHENTPEQIVEGIEAIVWSIQSKIPSAKIIVVVSFLRLCQLYTFRSSFYIPSSMQPFLDPSWVIRMYCMCSTTAPW